MRKHLVVCLFVILVFFCKTTTTIIIIILDSLMNRLFSLFTSSVRKSTEKKNENKQQQLMKATSYCHTYSIHSFITILWFIKFLSFFFLVFVFGSCNSFIYSNNNNIQPSATVLFEFVLIKKTYKILIKMKKKY